MDTNKERLWLRTKEKLRYFELKKETIRSYFDESKYTIKCLNWMQLGDKPIIIVHEPAARRDLVVAIGDTDEYETLHTIAPANSLQCCLIDNMISILDSN